MTENLYKTDCVRTLSGQYFNISDPEPTDVFITDIATQLSRICRYGGATKKFYSVAEHSAWCCVMAEELYPELVNLPLKLLLHDAHEYVLCDIPSPIKRHLVGYTNMVNKIQFAINTRFAAMPTPGELVAIQRIDRMALEWEWENKVLKWKGMVLPHEAAALVFLDHFKKHIKTPYSLHP